MSNSVDIPLNESALYDSALHSSAIDSAVIVTALVVVGCIAAGVVFFMYRLRSAPYDYRPRESLISPTEHSFYDVLSSVVGSDLLVFAKVRVADVLGPAPGLSRGEKKRAHNAIAARQFDFVLCDPEDLTIVCGLVLDYGSHNRKRSPVEHEFLAAACESGRFPYIRVNVREGYTRAGIESSLAPFLKRQASPAPSMDEPVDESWVPTQSLGG